MTVPLPTGLLTTVSTLQGQALVLTGVAKGSTSAASVTRTIANLNGQTCPLCFTLPSFA